jgi:predicted Zn-ribbon and HTH transcriptional regulator
LYYWRGGEDGTMNVNYYGRTKGETVSLDIPADVVAVHLPSRDSQPGLVVNVNTDAVLVDTADGRRVAMYEYSDLLSDAGIMAEEEELLIVQYLCPKCGHKWAEEWTSACDSECPECGTENITALSWEKAGKNGRGSP